MTKLSTLIRQMAKEGHRLASLERASVLSASDDPKDQDKAREIRVRHDYENLRKQISSKKKPTKPAIKEGMGNIAHTKTKKGGKTIINVSKNDEVDAQKAMKNDPKYILGKTRVQPYKEEVKRDEYGDPVGGPKISKKKKAKNLSSNTPDEQHTTTTSEAKVDKGRSDYGKASIRNYRRMGPGHGDPGMFDPEGKRGKTIDKRREEHKARRGVKGAKVPAYKVEEGKEEGGYISNAAKAEVRNQRRFGKKGSATPQGYFGQKPSEKAELAVKRGEEHKARRGVKTKGMKEEVVNEVSKKTLGSYVKKAATEIGTSAIKGDYKKMQKRHKGVLDATDKMTNETVAGGVPLTPQELEIQKKMSRLNVRLARKRSQEMQKAKIQDTETAPEQVKEEDKAFNTVVAALRKKHGKDAVITKVSKPKPRTEAQKKKAAAERKKRQDADNKAFAARAKKAGYKNPQDYANVVARYGSEDNYRKGKGLGT